MYSRTDILKAIKSKDLVIEGFDKKEHLGTTTIHFHLDEEIAVPKKATIDYEKTTNFDKYFKKQLIGKNGYKLKSGAFILARTAERIGISKKLIMLVDGRSTLARLGISSELSKIINAGHGVPNPRKIILEIKNNGPFDIILRQGMEIIKGLIFKLDTKSDTAYDSHRIYGLSLYRDELLPLKEM